LAASLVDSDEGPALLARAELALARDDFETALDLAARSAERLPENALADRVIGVAALALGDAERAEAALTRASEGGDPVARARLAELRLAEGEAGEAAKLLSKETIARLAEDERVSAIRARALALAESGDVGAAREALADLEGLDDEETIALRSKIAILAGEPEATVEALEARVAPLIKKGKAQPEDAPMLVAYAAALEASGDTKVAGSAYQLAVRSEPTSIEARIGYARALIRGRKEGQALRVLERGSDVLAERGDEPPTEFLVVRGRALLELGKRAEATTSLLEASERDDAPAETYFYLAEALAGRKTAESRAAYERYLELEPAGPHAKRAERAIQR
jgi:predicted Zn-dependent protease